MRILLAADVFPPRCGGAGWSSFHLARALRLRGHEVVAVVPREGGPRRAVRLYEGIPVREFGYVAPGLPLLRNLFRNELLWPRLGRYLAQQARAGAFDLIHAQHSLTIPAAVYAARIYPVPVVGTVRDYWPLCYRSTMLAAADEDCSRCDLPALVRCVGHPLGPPAPLLALVYPYLRGNVGRKARLLAQADAVIAVSHFVAGRLSGIVPPERLHVLPNLVDLEEVERIAAAAPATSLPSSFLLFVGKTEANKGVGELVAALERVAALVPAEARPPLLVAGDGGMGPWMEKRLAHIGWPARFLRWADHGEVLRLLRRTDLLLFPSRWEEPLSRVLVEACACGTPVLAMATGGTPEILIDGESGAVVPPEVQPFATRLRELLPDTATRRRLGQGARQVAEEQFSARVVAARVEQLYHSLVNQRSPLRPLRWRDTG